MAGIAKDDLPSRGRTQAFTVIRGGGSWPTCRSCGSVLYPQRRESVQVRTIGGERLTVEKFRCRCSVGREVRRPLERQAA
jgi:hypothetical protein